MLSNVNGIILSVSALPIILAVCLSVITIYLSAISIARRASKVSLVELLRNSQEIKINSKKLKTPKIISKLFKTGGTLAYKNLKRSKKKYRTTVLSLAVSIFVFISMNSFVVNMFDLSSSYYEDYDYNMYIYFREEDRNYLDSIKKLQNMDECFVLYESDSYLKITDFSKVNNSDIIEDDEESIGLNIKALDDETFRKYVKKIGVSYEKVKDKGILCDEYVTYIEDSGKEKVERTYNYKVGETIVGKYKEGEIEFKVGAISSVKPYGIENAYYQGGYLIVNKDMCNNVEFYPALVTIQSSNIDMLIKEMQDNNIDVSYSNYEEQAKAEKAMVLVIKIFLYGFITVITLIGVTNIFNTITSNIELRQKEFAMLKSIGMTKKEFNRMINLETIFYSTKSLAFGIVSGLIGTFAMYKAFSVKIDKAMYIPTAPILISIIAVFILVFVIMKYSISKVNKQNILETIRKDNI